MVGTPVGRNQSESNIFLDSAGPFAGPADFRAAFLDAPVAMALVGMRREDAGRYLAVNRMFCEQLLRTEAELLAMTVNDVTYAGDAEHTDAAMRLFTTDGTGRYDITKRHVRSDGTLLWVEATATFVRDADGVARYAVAHVVNVDERMQAFAAIQERDAEVARLTALETHQRLELELQDARRMESLGRIAAGVAHDFNNLVGVILNFATVAKAQSRANAALLEDLDHICEAAESAATISRRLLQFANVGNDERSQIDVVPLIQPVVDLVRVSAPHCEFEVSVACVSALVEISHHEFEQAFLNVLLNARDSITGTGRIAIDVRTGVGVSLDECLDISITDNGCGMVAEDRDRAFEPFFTTKPPTEGTGLGLAVVLGIVQSVGGAVMLESVPSKGTVVRLRLPCAVACASEYEGRNGD